VEHWVIDASVLVQAVVRDTYTNHVFALFATLPPDTEPALHIPEFCMLECTNVLWKRARFESQDSQQITLGLQNLLQLPLTYYKATTLLPRALAIGLAHGLAVYDSVYIALAETLGHPLITVDQRQAQAARAAGVALKPITDFAPLDSDSTP
jgi:predicted nucleic acid-binding protein